VEIIKWHTRAAYGCLVASSKFRSRGLSLRPIGCTPALSVTYSAAAAAVAACGAIQVSFLDRLSLPIIIIIRTRNVEYVNDLRGPAAKQVPDVFLARLLLCFQARLYVAESLLNDSKLRRAVRHLLPTLLHFAARK